mgnify:CR=1 FL=1
MTLDEGYIKYHSSWTEDAAPDPASAALLERWRRPLHSAGLIGYYKDPGVGYGNISMRSTGVGLFLISGTRTGHLKNTTDAHYALVTAYDIDNNTVASTGPVQASSEAMTHAAIYGLDGGIGAIVHGHSHALWRSLLNRLPTTDAGVAYGTPQMADEFRRLYRDTAFRETGLAVMAGHEEGLLSFGTTLEEATKKLLGLLDPAPIA